MIQAVNNAANGWPAVAPSPTPTATVGGSPPPTATPTGPPGTARIICEETFDGGWGDRYTDNGVWEVGIPTPAPAAHGGEACAGTDLDYWYPVNTDSRFISPGIGLPEATGDERIELRFWQWYSYSAGDRAEVHVSRWNGSGWDAWETVATPA